MALTALGLDDGSPEIPGGILGPVERVLVVGAGIAGLTVAHALRRAGTDCVVLEARRRIGGRLHTADVAGSPVDLGGSWIHHPIGNPLTDFARAVGIATRSGNPLATLSAFDRPTGLKQSPADVAASLTAEAEGFERALPDLRARLGPAASATEGIEAYSRFLVIWSVLAVLRLRTSKITTGSGTVVPSLSGWVQVTRPSG